MLCSVGWWLLKDVSGQSIGPVLKTGQIGSLEASINGYKQTLRNVQKQRRPKIYMYLIIIVMLSVKRQVLSFFQNDSST